MITVPGLLVRGLGLLPVDAPAAEEVPLGTVCAMTGEPITRGYRIAALASAATAEWLDTFHGDPRGWLGEDAARAWRWQRQTSLAAMIFEDGTTFRPLISRSSATESEGRPCWSDLVRAVWPERRDQACVILLVTEMKKRLWPRARVGRLGSSTALYVYDAGYDVAQSLNLDWESFLACLSLVEEVYSAGFVKANIREGLWGYYKKVQEVGYPQTRVWEDALVIWRRRPEFLPALLIAQKREEQQ